MDYPPGDVNAALMCRIWFERVILHGGDNILVLYNSDFPAVANEYKQSRSHVEIEKKPRLDNVCGHSNFMLTFKLVALAGLDFPFLYLDADMYVIHDLAPLWKLKSEKPWIGINHQRLRQCPDTRRRPFLNGGLQLVSDPKLYDFGRIVARFSERGGIMSFPGYEQAVLQDYFKSIGYDYTHPEAGTEWNSCAIVGRLTLEENRWHGITQGLAVDHPIWINHYWAQYKPWNIGCPLHAHYKEELSGARQ